MSLRNATEPGLELDSATLQAGLHRVRVFVSNWLGSKDLSARATFFKVNNAQPRVVSAHYAVMVDSTQDVDVAAEASLPACSSAGFSIRVRWSQVLNTAHMSEDAATSSASLLETGHRVAIAVRDTMSLFVPAGTLLPGRVYGFNLLAETLDPGGVLAGGFNTTFVVTVSEPAVVAEIDGGSTRRVSILVGMTSNVSLDAGAGSSDPAYPSSALSYSWTITPVDPAGPALSLANASAPILSIPSASLPAGRYRADVTVTGVPSSAVATAGATRSATASQTLDVVTVPVPLVRRAQEGLGEQGAAWRAAQARRKRLQLCAPRRELLVGDSLRESRLEQRGQHEIAPRPPRARAESVGDRRWGDVQAARDGYFYQWTVWVRRDPRCR